MIREMPSRDLTVLESGPGPEGATLADYLALVWRARVFLVLAAIVGGATMFARSISGPRVYESTVTFAVAQSKIGEGTPAIAAGTASFRPMVESLSTAAAVMHEVGLDQGPNPMRPSEFLEQIMSVSEVRGTNLIRVTVVYTDPALAATMANSVASHAVQVARDVSATEATHARDMIKKQLDEARRRLDEVDRSLRLFRQQAQIEAVQKDVQAQLAGRLGILDLLVSIASEKAKLARMEEELKNRPRVDTLNRTESVNKVYEDLDQEAATTRAYLASLEKQKTELVDVRKLGADKLAALNNLYALEGELARRQVEQDLAERIYVEISQRYEVASLQVVGRSAELSVIDRAVPADRPVPRQVARNTVVGAVAGFVLGLAGVLLWQAAGRMRPVPAR
jgi:uncharacterized protein involved in exopolysaccharide biosynthesis